MHRAAAVLRRVGDDVAGRDRRLVGDGRDGDVGRRPSRSRGAGRKCARGFGLPASACAVRRAARLAALGAVLQQAVAVHAEQRRDGDVVQERAVVDDRVSLPPFLKPRLLQHRLEADVAPLAGLHRRVELVDAVGVVLVLLRRSVGAVDARASSIFERRRDRLTCTSVERRAGAVFDQVVARGDRARFVRIERDVERHADDARLRLRSRTAAAPSRRRPAAFRCSIVVR